MLLVGIAATAFSTAYATGALNMLAGNHAITTTRGTDHGNDTTTPTDHGHGTTTPPTQPPSLTGEYTGSLQIKEHCNFGIPCGYNHFCYPGAPCENNFTITNKGTESITLSAYKFPDGQSGLLWDYLIPGESFALSLWDTAGYESSSIALTTSSGFTVTVGVMPPQSIKVIEGHGFKDDYHVSLTLIVQSNSSIPSPVTFTSYSIQDSKGNVYTNSSLHYTVIPFPSNVNVSYVGVNAGFEPWFSLGHLSLYYSPGFMSGQNYTITLTTSAYGTFPFQVIGGMFQAVITYSIQSYIVMDSINATGSLISMHFSVIPSSLSFYEVLVYDGNVVIGTGTCPNGGTTCNVSGSYWITVKISKAINTVDGYQISFSFFGDAPLYLVTF